MKQKPVPEAAYTKKYFVHFTDTSPEFRLSWGNILAIKHRFALHLAGLKKGMRILDLGCGRGEILIHGAKLGAHAWGVDFSSAGLKLAGKAISLQPKAIQKKIKLIRKEVTQLPFPKATFDRVFFLDVIEHLTPAQVDQTLSEIKRVLKKNGLLILHTWPNKLNDEIGYPFWTWPCLVLLSLLKGKFNFPPARLKPGIYDQKMHINPQSYFSLKKVLHKHGFKSHFRLTIWPLKNSNLKVELLHALEKAKPFSLTWPVNIILADHLWVIARK